jgi:hypothetical protein
MTARFGGLALLLALAGWLGCSSDIEIGRNSAPATPAQGGSDGMAGTGGTETGGSAGNAGEDGECETASCQGTVYACGNCEDDDGDGDVDSDDIHCTGPCDDSEASFAVDITSGTGPPCKLDCFFDGDRGSGNDGCNWSHTCDELSVAPDFPPSGDSRCAYDPNAPIPGMAASCDEVFDEQTSMCAETCMPLVPNGCDCFGCCELPAGSGAFVWLGSDAGCTMDALDDETLCRPCTRVPGCTNACDPCEVCVGRTTPDPGCTGEPPACPTGMDACRVEDGPRCGEGTYCITGCCVPEPK